MNCEPINNTIASKVLRLYGIEEREVEEKIFDIIEGQQNPAVVINVKAGEVAVSITAMANSSVEAEVLIKKMEKELRDRLGLFIYGEEMQELEEVVGKALVEKKLTIATAESCTGGLLAGRLINYPGISSVFFEGVITYSNDAKMKYLNVKETTLQKYGAVSSQTAEEMAEGIARAANTDIGISVTGIAGPGGGTEEKPVGLVYLGLYIKGITRSRKLNLKGDRQEIRRHTTSEALNWLRIELIN